MFFEYLYFGVYQGSKPQEGSCLWILCLDAGELGAFPLIVKSSWTELFWAAMEHNYFSFVSTFQSLMLSLAVRHNGTKFSLAFLCLPLKCFYKFLFILNAVAQYWERTVCSRSPNWRLLYVETLKSKLTFCEQPQGGIYLTERFTGIASMSHVLRLFSVTQNILSDLMQMLFSDHSCFVFSLPVGLLCLGKELLCWVQINICLI